MKDFVLGSLGHSFLQLKDLLSLGPVIHSIEVSTLADQNNLNVKGQGHSKMCMIMSFDISFVEEWKGK